MINSVIAVSTLEPMELVIILISLAVPIIFIAWILKMFFRHKNENIKLRLEVGKLADELERLRKKNNSLV